MRRRRRRLLLPLYLALALAATSSSGSASTNPHGAPSVVTPPTISGTAVAGATLTATTGTWNGATISGYAFQWKRCDLAGHNCSALGGATQTTYKLVSADVGATMRVLVTATNKKGSATAPSDQTGVVAPPPPTTLPPTNTALPQVSGTTQAGQTLSASTGSWTGSPTSYKYQWQRCDSGGGSCGSVSGATASTYALGSPDVGFTMRVAVSATNSAGTGTAISTQTSVVATAPVASPPANSALPQVTGTTQVGQTLTASNGTWSGSPTSYGYQWKRCDSAGAACAAISGATAKTFALTSTDVGKTLRASVTATNGAGSATATSAQTAVVAAAAAAGDVYSKPVPRYGLSPGYTILNRTSAMQDFELGRIVAVGAKLIRLDYWEEAKADVTVGKALALGLEPELVIGATMRYSGRDTVADFQAHCSRAASKYRGRIRYYEPMNEPNSNGWPAADFERYQAACYAAVKAVDSRNVVLFSGLNPATLGTQSVQWVSDFYAAGGKGSFDVMNVHAYGDPAVKASWSLWCKTFGCGGVVSPSVVDVMARNGDGGKAVVSTESGDQALNVGETNQATAVTGALKDPRVQQVYVYDMLNTVSGFGMLVADSAGAVLDPAGGRWRMRPSYAAYKSGAAG